MLNLIDQGASSLTSVVASVSVAVSGTSAEFGIFGLAFAMYSIALGLGRAFVGEPLIIRGGDGTDRTRRMGPEGALPAAVAVGAVLATVVLLILLILDSISLLILTLAAAALPLLLLQDAGRYWLLGTDKAARALVLDTTWLAIQSLALIVLKLSDRLDAESAAAAWLLGGCVTAIAIPVLHRLPAFRNPLVWFRFTSSYSLHYAFDFLVVSGLAYGLIPGLSLIYGLDSVGAVRGAQTVLGPLNVVIGGAGTVLLMEIARGRYGRVPLLRLLCGFSIGLTGIVAIWTAILLALPSSLGRYILGESWDASSLLLMPVGLSVALTAVCLPPIIALRAFEAGSIALKARFALLPVMLVGIGLFAYLLDGPSGAFYGLAAANVLGAAVWWSLVVRVCGRPTPKAGPVVVG